MSDSGDLGSVGTTSSGLGAGRASSAPAAGEPGRIDRRRPDRRALFLAEISRGLFETLDYEATLAKVAQLAMPELGAWCMLDLIGEDSSIRRFAVYHPNPALQGLATELQQQYPPAAGDLFGAPRFRLKRSTQRRETGGIRRYSERSASAHT
jgi:hypothetical protein